MYYKVLKDNKVIDLLENIVYIRYDIVNQCMNLANLSNAQGIMSSDERRFWHLRGLYRIPIEGYDTVDLVEISSEEYHQLKALNGKTPEEIIDEYTLALIEGGLI